VPAPAFQGAAKSHCVIPGPEKPEPGIHDHGPYASTGIMDSGFGAARRPGMMGWTAPDGIISAKLMVLIRISKGDRP